MKLHEIKPVSKLKKRRRVGRGISAGRGKTAGRGTKGQKARTGRGKTRPGFEGGQMPLVMRLPKKRGLGNLAPKKREFAVINIKDLTDFKESIISKNDIVRAGYAKKSQKIKLLGEGELDRPIEIGVDAVSGAAREKIEKAGGKVIIKSKEQNPNFKK